MIQVRLVFHGKLGKATEMVNAWKGAAADRSLNSRARSMRILTDLSGRFDTVVQELEYESMDDFMQDQAELFRSPAFQQGMQRSQDAIVEGYKEYYTVEFAR